MQKVLGEFVLEIRHHLQGPIVATRKASGIVPHMPTKEERAEIEKQYALR